MEQGEPSGVPAVFLHAYADSWRSFKRILMHLPSSIHAFAVTQRGHGDADRPASGYGVEEFAADLAAFMDAVALEAAVLFASSSASFTVQRFAVEHPDRTLGIVLSGAPWSLRDKAGASGLLEAVSNLRDPVDPAFVRRFVESTVLRPVRRFSSRRWSTRAAARLRLECDARGPAGGAPSGRDRHGSRSHAHPVGRT